MRTWQPISKRWITALRQVQNANRAGLDIVSSDPNFGTLKVSPVFYQSDADMAAYLEEHQLPNEWDYFDPAKASEKRECGLHAAWAHGGVEAWERGSVERGDTPDRRVASSVLDALTLYEAVHSYHLDHLQYLETEAVYVMREVAASFDRPALLFSGGKDSICLLRLAEKAFRPSDIPMPLLNIDTGHHFPELNQFRDHRAKQLGAKLIVRKVEDAIAKGIAVPTPGEISRNRLQIPTLL